MPGIGHYPEDLNAWADEKAARSLERARGSVRPEHAACEHTAAFLGALPTQAEYRQMGLWAAGDRVSALVGIQAAATIACEATIKHAAAV